MRWSGVTSTKNSSICDFRSVYVCVETEEEEEEEEDTTRIPHTIVRSKRGRRRIANVSMFGVALSPSSL